MVLGSEMPGQTRETDIPLWYKAQRGGDELRDLEERGDEEGWKTEEKARERSR